MEIIAKLSDNLRSFNDHIDLSINQKGVIVKKLKMTLSEFMNVISNSVDGVETLETPILPKNCVKLVSKPATNSYHVI